MEYTFVSLPESPFSLIALGGFAVFTIVQLVLLLRRNDIRTLRDANHDLRSSLDDKGREIAELREDVRLLQHQVADLDSRNRSLEDLFMKAVVSYFEENPAIALELRGKLTKKL